MRILFSSKILLRLLLCTYSLISLFHVLCEGLLALRIKQEYATIFFLLPAYLDTDFNLPLVRQPAVLGFHPPVARSFEFSLQPFQMGEARYSADTGLSGLSSMSLY